MNTNLMHYLSSVYFVNQPVHVSGIFVAHHQEVYCIYVYVYNWYVLCFSVDWLLARIGSFNSVVNCAEDGTLH